ncbi:MAG: glycosyltransferase family 39 protein [bacterium]
MLPAVVFWLTTPWGIGAAIDSVRYYEMANIFFNDSSLAGLGTHFPPLYPFLISLLAHLTDDISNAARILQFILIAVNATLAAILVGLLTRGSLLASLLIVVALTLRSEVFFLWHYALSEALFTALLLSHYLCLIRWQRNGKSIWLFVAGLLLGTALLARYAGLPFILFSAIGVAILCRSLDYKSILKKTVTLLSGAFLFPLFWLFIALNSDLRSEPRSFHFHPIQQDNLSEGVATLGKWLSQGLGYPVGVLIFAALVYACWRFLHNGDSGVRTWIGLFIWTILGYLTFILVSLIFFDAHIKLQGRIFYPALILFLIAATVVLTEEFERPDGAARFLFLSTLVVLAGGSAASMHTRALTRIHQGEGFYNALYRNMEVWKHADKYKGENIVSNGPELIRLHLNIGAVEIPPLYNPVTRELNNEINQQLQALKLEVLNGDTTVIYFASMQWRDDLPTAQQVMDLMQINPDYLHSQVMIFHVPDSRN